MERSGKGSMMAKTVFGLAVFGLLMSGCSRTVVGTFRSSSPGYKYEIAIRTAGPLGEPYDGKNKKEARIAFFSIRPEKSAGEKTITVTATKPQYQVEWDGDERVTIDVVEFESGKGMRTLASAVFVFDPKRNRFKKI